MKVSRRELVALLVATTAVAQEAPEEQSSEMQIKRNADALDKFELKQDTEPAFAFKA
jgi:hypothetical protein